MKNQRSLAIVVLLVLLSITAAAQERGRYQLVQFDASVDIESIVQMFGVDHLHGGEKGTSAVLREDQVEQLRRAGTPLTVRVEDLEQFYAERARTDMARMRKEAPQLLSSPSGSVPHFTLGSAGGYYTLDELDTELRRMQAEFPALVGEPMEIGRSVQGRPIVAVRISAIDEDVSQSLPEVLFTALHHAREPMGMMNVVYSTWWLLERYGNDPAITHLLNNRALYIVPMVNPDGYAYNLKEHPNGGGLWRGNLRAENQAVDLNRNYGPREYWDMPEGGSSPQPNASDYRGPEPFSEPETRAIRDFCLSRRFRTALNHHSFGNVVIYPFNWSVTGFPDGDTLLYHSATPELALENGYASGPLAATLGYRARGTADDWMYSFGNPGNTIAVWTPETGNEDEGFWPAPSSIEGLCRVNLPMSISTIWMAGAYPRITGVERIQSNGDVILRITVTNLGREAMTEGAGLGLEDIGNIPPVTVPPLLPLQNITVDLTIPGNIAKDSLKPRPTLGLLLTYRGAPLIREIAPIVHPSETIFFDDFENAVTGWEMGDWGKENVDGRGKVLSDSPYSHYFTSDFDNILALRNPIALHGYTAVDLRFDVHYAVLASEHRLALEIRSLENPQWSPLSADYLQQSVTGEGVGERNLMRGLSHGWRRITVNLDRFLDTDVELRLVMETGNKDVQFSFDGVMIDNVAVTGSRPLKSSIPTDGSSAVVAAFPNPFSDRLIVRTHGPSLPREIRLLNMLGETLLRVPGESEVMLDTEGIPSGWYMVRCLGNGFDDAFRIVHLQR